MRIAVINFNSGEVSPEVDARKDIAKYTGACRRLENVIPDVYGNGTRRPGTVYIGLSGSLFDVFNSISVYEGEIVCFENNVVTSNLSYTDTMDKITCYENQVVCYDGDISAISNIAFINKILCHDEVALTYENNVII